MKIRMKMTVSGLRNGQPWPPRGGVLDVPDAEGAALCAMGGAEPVAEADADVEKAVPEDDAEQRTALTRQTAGAVVNGADAEDSAGDEPTGSAEPAPAPAKKAAPARKTAAKKPAVPPADDSK
ncbi:hypothetical protein [Streptomyces sp. NPDC091215]|uniref:hypothetical protein n=1 Tax=Streptomyces sp. NPDC091215 TaxID=3155192 RepID=UPI00343AAC69